MARIDDLVAQIPDKVLRQRLEAALAEMKRRQRFGLVYEEHVPETTALLRFPVQVGATVQRRSDTEGSKLYQVTSLTRRSARLEPEGGGPEEKAALNDLLVVKRFGDPIFPALTALGAVRKGPPEKPHHAVINGENFHTLQLLVYLYEGQVDCIYIDPPYNTGARDWKYNNRYVDSNDTWNHSKWLGFMEKRLWLAKRLLKPDGVLISRSTSTRSIISGCYSKRSSRTIFATRSRPSSTQRARTNSISDGWTSRSSSLSPILTATGTATRMLAPTLLWRRHHRGPPACSGRASRRRLSGPPAWRRGRPRCLALATSR
jgi:DNA methylase